MPQSSHRSDAVFVPRRDYSPLATSLWLAQHGLPAAALAFAGLSGYVKCIGWLGIAVSLWCARPLRTAELKIAADGTWSLPSDAVRAARLLPATRFTHWWVELHLATDDGCRTCQRLWYDAFAPSDWRRLLILLRESRGSG